MEATDPHNPTADGNNNNETSVPPPSSSEEEDERRKKSFAYTKSVLLGKRIRTTLSDGRTLTGRFICIDRLNNLILTNVTEERFIDPLDYRYRTVADETTTSTSTSTSDNDENDRPELVQVQRHISQAMIPGSRLVRAELRDPYVDDDGAS